MSKSLLDLLNKTRGDIASKRGNNVDLTRLKDGNNYLRIFPNKDDPNGVFFQTFGMHYVKHQNEEGKDVTTAYICEQHTHGHACQLCEMVMEGRARFKGNKAMEATPGNHRSTPGDRRTASERVVTSRDRRSVITRRPLDAFFILENI
nr:hypothetical protein [Enterobacter hormaechei]